MLAGGRPGCSILFAGFEALRRVGCMQFAVSGVDPG